MGTRAKKYDVTVSGSWGMYTATANTLRGKRWLRVNAPEGPEHTYVNGSLLVEGGNPSRLLVAGMVRDGLAVEVNGVDMTGFSEAAQ
jgi:hypothetical protein